MANYFQERENIAWKLRDLERAHDLIKTSFEDEKLAKEDAMLEISRITSDLEFHKTRYLI